MTASSRIAQFFGALGRRRDSYARYGDFLAQTAITDGDVPLLALSLAAATRTRLALQDGEVPRLSADFVPAVVAMDRADVGYLQTIEETLPATSARDTLTTMAGFRKDVSKIRQQTRIAIADLYGRYDRSYGWFDPIDPCTPSPSGLTHADGTRVATIADGARLQVEKLRAAVNQSVTAQLEPSYVEALIAAKRRRRAAFTTALGNAFDTAFPAGPLTPAQRTKTLYELTDLADGWY